VPVLRQPVSLDCLDAPMPHLPTGIQALDEAIGGTSGASGVVPSPGFPRGAINLVWGATSCGKTTLALTACATTIRQGGTAVYVDLEHEITSDRAMILGVPVGDWSHFRLVQPATLEEGLNLIQTFATEGVDLVVADSVGAELLRMASAEPVNEGEWDSHMANEWAARLPELTATIRQSGSAVVGIAQSRKSRGPLWSEVVEVPQGGHAWRHHADLQIEMCPTEVIRDEVYDAIENRVIEKVVGQVVWARILNRLSEGTTRSVLLDFRHGGRFTSGVPATTTIGSNADFSG